MQFYSSEPGTEPETQNDKDKSALWGFQVIFTGEKYYDTIILLSREAQYDHKKRRDNVSFKFFAH